MKICFVTTHFDQGRGGGELFANLFSQLTEYQFTVVTAKQTGEQGNWQTHFIKARAVTYAYALSDYLFSQAVMREVPKLHAREKFDLIFINQVVGSLLDLKKLGIPVIYMIHHPVSVDVALSLGESQSLKERLTWRLRYLNMIGAQKSLARQFDHVLTVSETTKQRILDDYQIAPEKVTVIYNGIDTEFFKKTKPTEPKTVLAVGSYQGPRKGFLYLEQVYRKLSSQGFSIVDVGRRWDAQDAQLKDLPRLRQIPYVQSHELPDVYSRASVFISTALYEGFGLTPTEALACQTPAIVFKGGGINDVMDKIDPDLLCEPKDVDGMVAKVLAWDAKRDEAKLQDYRLRVKQYFDLRTMAQGYRSYFEVIIKNSLPKITL